VSTDKHKQLLEQSMVFVQHSRIAESGDSEGTPVAILEASAAGLPVVSTLHAGIPMVILQGKSGLLVKENDVNTMADSIVTLLNDIELCKEMGAKGKEYIQQNYSLKHHINTITRIIETCI
jgi:glycosyltransferase involved in cell wall biosynthesis